MKFIIDKELLLDAINIVNKAVSGKVAVSILECVLVTAIDGFITLLSNNLELAIETKPVTADVIETGSVAIESRIFTDIVRMFPEQEITVETDNNNIMTLSCRNAAYKILGLPGDEFPPLPDVAKEEGASVSCIQFKNLVRQTIFSISGDETRGVLTGELLLIDNGILSLISSDGFRISVRYADYDGASSLRAIIPGRTLNEITKILPNSVEERIVIYKSDKQVIFELDSCTIVSRLIEGDFINYESIFSAESTTVVRADKIALLGAIERALLIAKDTKKNPVKFDIESGALTVNSMTEMGTTREEINIELDGQPINISFNPRFLTDILKVVDEDIITVRMTTPLSPVIITSEENENFKYLVLPLRTKG